MTIFLMALLVVTAIFMILLILVQRGRGGGLAGALGGMGGQSAFGTKAGDTFTRVTIGVAAFWIILCAFTVRYERSLVDAQQHGLGTVPTGIDAPPGSAPGATGTPGATTDSPGAAAPGASLPAEQPTAPADND